MQMTDEQNKVAAELFAPTEDPREGKTILTVRFDVERLELLHPTKPGKGKYRRPYKGLSLLRYVEDESAKTPTRGSYVRCGLTVRSSDGRLWYGTMKKGTDEVKLRLAPKEKW